ncbi:MULTISPECIES: hypothetical protein [Mesorhizobium]|uniref:hypothetical protein n=1 Tax=Mesorhizobium TaxID=68287 RepID=UPI000BAF67F5|nr:MULTISPECIES: hypothetical protein [Mesorhizobium]PBB39714.1 hypothetical protein CK221_02595 [Mesorhizobium sp. WSM3868]PBB40802.1 hypothetical protein CK222_25855 [Mesorhizobium sp. WSM3866]PBB58882.1 hypothetical protein CK217_27430 [Mesorhizobium loti]PBB85078.1 hypothetical protein CK216_19500 [Mesorhizobium sp. WSM3876]
MNRIAPISFARRLPIRAESFHSILAERSSADFGIAEEVLMRFAKTRRTERVAAEWRLRLDDEAKKLFGDGAARIVRQAVDGKLDGRPPLIYCRDERTFLAALGVLQWIAQTL